jgi:hypothetical protein
MTTIRHTLNIPGNGLFDSDTSQARFLKRARSYTTDTDPRLPGFNFLAENFGNVDTIMTLSDVGNVPIPSELSGTVGSLRLAEEVMFYSQVFLSNNSLLITQRTVANTARSTANSSVAANTIVSLLGLRTV